MKTWILDILNIFLNVLKNFFVKKTDYPFDIQKDGNDNIVAIAADFPFYKDGAFGDESYEYVTREEVNSIVGGNSISANNVYMIEIPGSGNLTAAVVTELASAITAKKLVFSTYQQRIVALSAFQDTTKIWMYGIMEFVNGVIIRKFEIVKSNGSVVVYDTELSGASVQVDNATIDGNGTSGAPLSVLLDEVDEADISNLNWD